MRLIRRQVVAVVASWLLCALVVLHVYRPGKLILGNGDSVSHFGHSLLFARHGFDVYKKPSKDFCHVRDTDAAHAYAKVSNVPECDICEAQGGEGTRPFFVNWQDFPQPYPPGSLLYSAPEAWLFAHTSASLRTISVFTRLKYLCAAHFLLWLLFGVLFGKSSRGPGVYDWLLAGLFALLYCEIIKWSLSGMYDPLAIAAVVLGVCYLARRRDVDALLALSVGVFFHYRALWYAPLFAIALVQLWRNRGSARNRIAPAVKIGLAAALVGLSAYSFLLLYPSLRAFPETNAILYKRLALREQNTWDFALPLVFIVAYVARARHWLLLLTIAWQCFMLVMTPQTMAWHALFLIPMVVMARLTEDPGAMVAATGFYWLEAQLIFGASMWPGQLISAALSP
jgi:hypothetical protein